MGLSADLRFAQSFLPRMESLVHLRGDGSGYWDSRQWKVHGGGGEREVGPTWEQCI